MTTTQLAAWVMLAFGGLYSGAILFYAVDRVHVWRRMSVDQYVVDFRRSLYRADPLVPIMGVLSELGAAVFAINSGGRAAVLASIGIALIAMIIVASISLAEPINRGFGGFPRARRPIGRTAANHLVQVSLGPHRRGAGRTRLPGGRQCLTHPGLRQSTAGITTTP